MLQDGTDSEMATGFFANPSTIGLNFSLRGSGHGQAFDDHVCNVVRGSDLRHSRLLGFGDELRMLQRFQESRFHGAHANRAARRAAWHVRCPTLRYFTAGRTRKLT
jgi:hypothetical protein